MYPNETKRLEWSLLHYQNMVDAIENAKKRQWALTNYVLLMYAGIIYFFSLLNLERSNFKALIFTLLYTLTIMIGVAGIYHLVDIHRCMVRYRRNQIKMSLIYEQAFFKDFPIRIKDYNFRYYFGDFTIIFILFITIGQMFVAIYFMHQSHKDLIFPLTLLVLAINFLVSISCYCSFRKALNKDTRDRLQMHIA